MRQQGDGTVAGDQDKLDKETAATASPSRPTAADSHSPGAQRDIDVLQQVEGNRPATGTGTNVLGKQIRTTANASLTDLANAATGHDRPTVSGSPGVQLDADMSQQGNGTVAGDQDNLKLDKETAAIASPRNLPTAADGLCAQRDLNAPQQVD